MLYLTRKKNQSIIIDGNIEITIVELNNNTVKLGVLFPKNVTILRKEIHDNIAKENLSATLNLNHDEGLNNIINSMNPIIKKT